MIDPTAIERTLHDLTGLIEEQGFETEDEVEEYARGFAERGEIPHYEPQTDLERAQAKMYDAWSATRPRKRVRLAKDALKICPDSAGTSVGKRRWRADSPGRRPRPARGGVVMRRWIGIRPRPRPGNGSSDPDRVVARTPPGNKCPGS
jgi:hypothetical protein